MPTMWNLLGATAVVVGGSASLLAGGIANADPAPPAPAPNIGQQLISTVANAPQILQSFATALGAAPPAPATPPPLASASVQMPQVPSAAAPGAVAAIPGAAPLLPGPNSLIPGVTASTQAALPAVSPAASGPTQLLPSAQLRPPQMPILPVPLPQQLSLPGDLASLATGGVPVQRGIQPGPTPVPAPGSASATPSSPLAPILSALP
jgi:hypothetical protein